MWGASVKRFVVNFNLESCLLKDHKPEKHAFKKILVHNSNLLNLLTSR